MMDNKDPCPSCPTGSVCRTPNCGRLKKNFVPGNVLPPPGQWISAKKELPVATERYGGIENYWVSPRMVLIVKLHMQDAYLAFGRIDHYGKWKIEGHNGDYNDDVKYWMKIPKLPEDML